MIGGGFMAKVHTRGAVAARALPMAIASSTRASAERAATALGYQRAHADPFTLIADPEIDVVHICTPNVTHVEYASAALATGKHVICEKPLATSAEQGDVLAQEAARLGLTATVPFAYRFHPMVREAQARVASGEIGSLLNFQGVYLQDWLLEEQDDDWRVDPNLGGPSRAFADVGSHLVDMIEFVTGDRIARVSAVAQTVHDSRSAHSGITTEDAVAVIAEMQSGAIGTLFVSQVSPGRKNYLAFEVAGRKESVRFEQENPETLWVGRRSGSTVLPRDPGLLSSDAARLSVLPAGHSQGYQDAFNAFIADSYTAVLEGAPGGLPNFADGARAARVTDAVLATVASGGWAEVAQLETAAAGGIYKEEKRL